MFKERGYYLSKSQTNLAQMNLKEVSKLEHGNYDQEFCDLEEYFVLYPDYKEMKY